MRNPIRRFSLLVLGVVAVSACEQREAPLAPEGGLETSRAGLPTIVEIAAGSDQFEVLVAAVQAAGLVEALSGPRHYTVFAPTDAAFLALCDQLGLTAATEEGCATDLVNTLGTETLTEVLLYHVTRGDRDATSVVNAGELKMLNGDVAAVTVEEGTAFIDGAPIEVTDLRASNGIVHVIGGVMLPGD